MNTDCIFQELNIGDKASFSKTISESDIYNFAGITGDFNPAHINASYAKKSRFKKRVAHGMLSASLISTVLGSKLPGAGTVYLSQELSFQAPVYIGDTLTATVVIVGINCKKTIYNLDTNVFNQDGTMVIKGKAVVMKE